MRVFTRQQCILWLQPSGITLDGYGRAAGAYDAPLVVYALLNQTVSPQEIARRAFDWLPVGKERLIYLWDWAIYPPDHNHLFEAVRRGCGANSSLIETPGHVFISTKAPGVDYDDRPPIDVGEESIAMWIAGLALEWTWQGIMAVEGCQEFVELGDGFLRFHSPSRARLEDAATVSGELGLRIFDRFPWQ